VKKEINDFEFIKLPRHIYISELFYKRKFKKVISEFEKLTKDDKENYPLIQVALAIAHSEIGEKEISLDILLSAEKKFEDHFEIEFQIAKIYEDMKNFEQSMNYLEKSYLSTPEENKSARSDCLNDLGAIYYNQGNKSRGLEFWKKAVEINPANKVAKGNILFDKEERLGR